MDVLVARNQGSATSLADKQWQISNFSSETARHFGTRDVRELTTRDCQLFIEKLTRKRSDLSSSTRNMLMATFRNVLKVARDDGLIDVVPATPRQRQKDNPRSFFRFAPLVEPERDEYQQLLQGAIETRAPIPFSE